VVTLYRHGLDGGGEGRPEGNEGCLELEPKHAGQYQTQLASRLPFHVCHAVAASPQRRAPWGRGPALGIKQARQGDQ
jgi:hypothetical protein